MKINYQDLQKKINFKFKNLDLLTKSLTHKSFDSKNNNEKLEFLGDRVLGLIIAKKLLEIYPDEKECILDKKFASLVNKKTCLEIAKKINLEKYVLTFNPNNKKINDLAQDDDSPYGKVLTIEIDEKNNFNYKIFSKGHRNPQGISLIDDKIFSVEHGPRGGDELNIIYKNENYGWPLFSLGSTYELDEIPNNPLIPDPLEELIRYVSIWSSKW